MEQVISALESVVCALDPTTPKESILDELLLCNNITIDQLNQSKEKLTFYGWNPRTHSPFVTFQYPFPPASTTNGTDSFVVDSLFMKLHNFSCVITAVNTILQTRGVYFVNQ
jgi:hypothetical protein